MRVTYSDKTRIIMDIRELLQAALDERRTLKSVVRELDEAIAVRRKREETQRD